MHTPPYPTIPTKASPRKRYLHNKEASYADGIKSKARTMERSTITDDYNRYTNYAVLVYDVALRFSILA
jgi:hypothetical protein